jgi:hypothetical protein
MPTYLGMSGAHLHPLLLHSHHIHRAVTNTVCLQKLLPQTYCPVLSVINWWGFSKLLPSGFLAQSLHLPLIRAYIGSCRSSLLKLLWLPIILEQLGILMMAYATIHSLAYLWVQFPAPPSYAAALLALKLWPSTCQTPVPYPDTCHWLPWSTT